MLGRKHPKGSSFQNHNVKVNTEKQGKEIMILTGQRGTNRKEEITGVKKKQKLAILPSRTEQIKLTSHHTN